MKNLVLKVNYANWDVLVAGDLNKIEWNIYDDYSVERKVIYFRRYYNSLPEEYTRESEFVIEKEIYVYIMSNIERAKSIDKKIEAEDGEAWGFAQFSNDEEVWKRKLSYIYTIEPLENIADVLMNIKRVDVYLDYSKEEENK